MIEGLLHGPGAVNKTVCRRVNGLTGWLRVRVLIGYAAIIVNSSSKDFRAQIHPLLDTVRIQSSFLKSHMSANLNFTEDL